MARTLSYSEVSTALTCLARWDFAYGGRLAGSTLKQRQIAPVLSNGRAWGAAVAAWHSFLGPDGPEARMCAHGALRRSLEADAEEQRGRGFLVTARAQIEAETLLVACLDHYMDTAERLPNLTRLEGELDFPIPGTDMNFSALIDGYTVDEHAEGRIAEFKFRTKLTSVELLALSRQPRWYGWSLVQELLQERLEVPIVGVIVDERLAEAPKPARLVKGKRKGQGYVPSHATSQVATPSAYVALCEEHDVIPQPHVIDALGQREWQQRTPITFLHGEIEESGRELQAAANLIGQLDRGELFPIRNAQPHICRGCKFKKICANPEDGPYIETIFERTVPKRLRPPREEQV